MISTQNMQNKFDTGPLSWVMAETREALLQTKRALHDALDQSPESQLTLLKHAKTYLHQAHGALQMVDVDGVAKLTQTIEVLLDRMHEGQLTVVARHIAPISQALDGIQEYLDGLLVSASQQPVRLFPYYQNLMAMISTDRISPVDLFSPTLVALTPINLIQDGVPANALTVRPVDYAALRKRFEMALLLFLKQKDPVSLHDSLLRMQQLLAEVWAAQTTTQSRAFWAVLHGFVELTADQKLYGEQQVKQLFGRINLQIRKLVDGTPTLPDSVLRDALFFIARADQSGPNAAQIRSAYQLDGQVPAQFERPHLTGIESGVLAICKERLSQIKTVWSKIAGGESALADKFEQRMIDLTEVAEKLHTPALVRLMRLLTERAHEAARARMTPAFALEMATSLLFVESALDQITRLPDDFATRADIVAARLAAVLNGAAPDSDAPWLDELSQKVQQRQTMEVLVAEMQSSLRVVEKTLDEYFREPGDTANLEQIDPIMHQIAGALAILDQDQAQAALHYTQGLVRELVQASTPPDAAHHAKIAQNIGAMSFLIEALQTQPESARDKFSFDAESGHFRSHFLDQAVTVQQPEPEFQIVAAPVAPESVAQQGSIPPAAPAQTPPDPGQQAAPVPPVVPESATVIAAVDENEQEPIEPLSTALPNEPPILLSAPDIDAPVSPIQPLPEPPAMPLGDDAVDAELLEVFLMEAEEVIAAVNETIPASRQDVTNQDHLITLRRAFHTLKGSSRMVGLGAFGNAAWSIEQVMNGWLSDAKAGTDELYRLLEKAAEVLGLWVSDLSGQGWSRADGLALSAAAEHFKNQGSFFYDAPPLDVPVQHEVPVVLAPTAQAAAPILEQVAPGPLGAPSEPSVVKLDELSAPELSFDFTPLEPEPAVQDDDASSTEQQHAKIFDFPGAADYFPPFEDTVKKIGDIEIGVPLYNIYLAETDEILRFLIQDFAEWRHEPQRVVTTHAVHAAHSLAGSSATVGFLALHEVAHALEMVLQRLERYPVNLLPGEFDTLDHCMACVKDMLHQFALAELPAHKPQQILVLEQLLAILTERVPPSEQSYVEFAAHPAQALETIELVVAKTQQPTPRPSISQDKAEPATNDFAASPAEDFQTVAALVLPKDDIDAELLPIFLEEGSDLFPQIGQTLRQWQSAPQDNAPPVALLRLLHTVKGSARMAGAMTLGQHTHDMESEVENFMQAGILPAVAIEGLLARHDVATQMFEQLRQPAPLATLPLVSSSMVAANAPGSPEPADRPLVVAKDQSAALAEPGNAALVRVRADILDRLVNQAGEVSISRSRLENEVSSLKSSLVELNENVGRLRGQLREVEIQAETQISSRMAMSGEREFDPLEFDRFTRLQELTRMMAESVNDVSTLQVSISKTVDGATDDLISQARLTRELQQDLMRVRMVPFASISERLYRITRQTSKELDKRINLDIRGTSVEIDRSVLEKMAGPFEHLLRNAIVHGIESRQQRLACGKNEVGEILVQIRQEGNEVVINFNDDGAGLDMQKIRDKARQTGLLALEDEISDAQASNLIFQSGFTTAKEVTELAGRGVGMDVVRSEAAALGGRVSVSSTPGAGSNFTIHLPLTLAVTQVVLLSCGARIYAVPSVLVEQVQQLKAPALASAYNEGAIMWQGQRVSMHYLSTILADYNALPVSQQYTPIIIMRSGNDRVALHVDEVIGNREVVVKNIGQQLSRMAGISGATVLGSGDIVLILNPLPLAQKMESEMLRAPRILQQSLEGSPLFASDDAVGAVADSHLPVQGLRRNPIVMVVDDSLTVRKVSQRLLLREGYQVVLAKDGVDALQQLQSITPDVMLVDIEMPRMDGFDLTRNVRNDARLSQIPIIMITSRTADKHRNYAMELGVNAYFGKPFQEDALLAAIQGFVSQLTPIH